MAIPWGRRRARRGRGTRGGWTGRGWGPGSPRRAAPRAPCLQTFSWDLGGTETFLTQSLCRDRVYMWNFPPETFYIIDILLQITSIIPLKSERPLTHSSVAPGTRYQDDCHWPLLISITIRNSVGRSLIASGSLWPPFHLVRSWQI